MPGTRAIVEAWQRKELRGIEGIVSNLITTDERYARAMDVAFGARLSNVVTTTSEDAERCVEFLNRKEAGRATFLPLDTLAKREGRHIDGAVAAVPGVLGYAHTLVRTAPQFVGIVNFLVGNVLIVTTLEVGIELARGRGLRDTIVTLGGEQITGGGAITGGRFVRERSILSRRFQAASLRDALEELKAKLEAATAGCTRRTRAPTPHSSPATPRASVKRASKRRWWPCVQRLPRSALRPSARTRTRSARASAADLRARADPRARIRARVRARRARCGA